MMKVKIPGGGQVIKDDNRRTESGLLMNVDGHNEGLGREEK